ncbi:hypothetical protein NIES4106_62320 (plasmid) [Fischerella sp. NIES-4106]|nr:hypothetical protein NIES4106_62320 [Fischerella sp. NIES-4106]
MHSGIQVNTQGHPCPLKRMGEAKKPSLDKEKLDEKFNRFDIDESLEIELEEIIRLANDFKTKYHALKNIRRFING